MKLNLHGFSVLLWSAFREWWQDNIIRYSASLAFYTIFSLAPLLLIMVEVVGLVFTKTQVETEMIRQLEILIGPQGAEVARDAMKNFGLTSYNPLAAVIGVLTVLLGATAVFAELQTALNKIWDVKVNPDRSLFKHLIRQRLRSLGIVVGVGFLLMVSLIISALLGFLQSHSASGISGVAWLWRMLHTGASFFIIMLLFAMIYRYLPDVDLTWRDVGVGAAITAVLFTTGKFLIGTYLSRATIAGAYGAAGSLVVLLVWVYYSALISFFGAEFTQVYTRRYGSGIRPKKYAVWVGEKPTNP